MNLTRENELHGLENALDMVSGPRNAEKIEKQYGFSPFGAGYPRRRPAVIKSAASAASLDGFSSRDQVGC